MTGDASSLKLKNWGSRTHVVGRKVPIGTCVLEP